MGAATASAPATPAKGGASRGRRFPAGEAPLLPLALARGTAFGVLALFAGLHWMAMVEPAAGGRTLLGVALGLGAALGLLAAGHLALRAARAAAAAIALAALPLALLAGGAADEWLRPDNWGRLAEGVARGLEALPGVRLPYRGVDEWVRLVIPVGGTLLATGAGLLAFWPRRRRTGFPLAALAVLVALYAVPAVALDFEGEFLRGAVLTLLVLAFLRLETLRRREAGPAATLAGGAALLALVAAPLLDRSTPLWDYENWALASASSRTTSYAWNHDYGPLDWPRDGREILRVRASSGPAYWKAGNLDEFDGLRWQEAPFTFNRTPAVGTALVDPRAIERWTQEIRVTVRNLRSRTFVTAGTPVEPIEWGGREPRPSGVASIFTPGDRTLRRGDAYRARVYTPSPTPRQLADTSGSYSAGLSDYRRLQVPGMRVVDPVSGSVEIRAVPVYFPRWSDWAFGEVPRASVQGGMESARRLLRESRSLAGVWALSQELRAEAGSPWEYVRAVERYLADGFFYTETPPPAAQTLSGFLLDARAGFCQQFSGAMALLLRMAGIPARVASGFAPGSLDQSAGEYVVRDLDAHSWVEVWFEGYGWVARDPTPASAPPRSQTDELGRRPQGSLAGAPDLGGDRIGDARGTGGEAGAGSGVGRTIGLGGLGAALAATGALVVVRRRRPALAPFAELERALRRSGRDPGPSATLTALERRFGRTPPAAAYLRAIREARYRDLEAAAPSTRAERRAVRAQRRALRAELARGGGLLGRLRAWWALPPRL